MTISTWQGRVCRERKKRPAIEKSKSPTGNDFFFRTIPPGVGRIEYMWKLFQLDIYRRKIAISIKEPAPEGLIVYKPNGSTKTTTTIQVVVITSSV